MYNYDDDLTRHQHESLRRLGEINLKSFKKWKEIQESQQIASYHNSNNWALYVYENKF